MIKLKSRYESTRRFQPGPDGNTVFPGSRPRKINGAEGVVQHTVREGERMDLLGRHYYNDERLWWRIMDANPEFLCAHDLIDDTPPVPGNESGANTSMVGRSIRIPRAEEQS